MIKWFERNRNFSIILFVFVAVEIFLFSSISGREPAFMNVLNVSVIYHFSVFFLLNFFLLISLNGNKDIKIKYLIISFIFSIIYSILDEIHQLFVPFRYANLGDIMTNNAGIFLSALVYIYSKKSRKD